MQFGMQINLNMTWKGRAWPISVYGIHMNEHTISLWLFPWILGFDQGAPFLLKFSFSFYLMLVFLFHEHAAWALHIIKLLTKELFHPPKLKVDRGHLWLCTLSTQQCRRAVLQFATTRQVSRMSATRPVPCTIVRNRTWPSRKRCENSGVWRNNCV